MRTRGVFRSVLAVQPIGLVHATNTTTTTSGARNGARYPDATTLPLLQSPSKQRQRLRREEHHPPAVPLTRGGAIACSFPASRLSKLGGAASARIANVTARRHHRHPLPDPQIARREDCRPPWLHARASQLQRPRENLSTRSVRATVHRNIHHHAKLTRRNPAIYHVRWPSFCPLSTGYAVRPCPLWPVSAWKRSLRRFFWGYPSACHLSL
jgi:hypothetical protein